MLTPSQFGIVAIALSFISAVDQFAQLGIEEALIRLPRPDPAHYNTAVNMTARRSAVIAAISAIGAWPVADFLTINGLCPSCSQLPVSR